MERTICPPNQDLFFLTGKDLQALRRADRQAWLRCFRDKRVIEVGPGGELLWARVEDEEFDFPSGPDRAAGGRHLSFACECDPEPGGVCSHQIATLFSYSDCAGKRTS